MKQRECQALLNCLKSTIGLLDLEQEAQLRKDVVAICNYLENPNFQIAVFGPFNHGKSTLLNALLGNRALPIDLIPTTGAAISVKHGNQLRTEIVMLDGRAVSEDGTEILKRYALLDENRRMRHDVASIQVFCPHPWLQTGVELLDLPGTNDREAQDILVRDRLLSADLVVQVLDARKLMTLGERENLRDWLIDRGIRTVIFVVNFLNLLEEPEEQKQVYNRLLFVAESFRSDLPNNISNIYRVDALPALRARLKGDISAAKSTGIITFESALQNIVLAQQERLNVGLPRIVAIANQVKLALLAKAQTITTDLLAAQKKREAKIQLKQKAEKLIKQGFQSSVSTFQAWLYLPKLLECYQLEMVTALQQGKFKAWETEKFQPAILEHKQAIIKWVHQACEFFNRSHPADLWIPLPDEPEVFLPEPTVLNQPNNSTGLVTEISQLLVETIGSVVVGGATYLFGQQNHEKPESSDNHIIEAYKDAVTDYLIRFNTQATSALQKYQEIAQTAMTFEVNDEPSEVTNQHHYLKLLHNLLDNLNQELESVS